MGAVRGPRPPASAPSLIKAAAPIRVCDNGGWTDTWFAGHGKVLNIGVHPCVEVQVTVRERSAVEHSVVLNAADFGDRYELEPSQPGPDRHPLLEAAIRSMPLPTDARIAVRMHSEARPGC